MEYKEKIDILQKEIDGIKFNLDNVSSEEYALSSEVEKILEQKKAEMLISLQELQKNSKTPEEIRLYELKYRVVESSVKLDKGNKDLNDFDEKLATFIENIEEEEYMLRNQQLEIESSLKELESDQIFINEYEEKIKRLDQIDAPISFSLDNCKSPLEEFYRHELKDCDDYGGNMAEASYLEIVEKTLGKQVTGKVNPRATNKKYYRLRLEGTTQADRNFYEKIMPLLEGAELYKKSSKTEKKISYNPLDELTPEVCGYGIRYFYLHKSLEKIESKQPMKPGFDLRLRVDQIISPKISKDTLSLLQSQGRLENEELDYESPYNQPIGMPNFSMLSPMKNGKDNIYYPFSIALSTKEKIKIVAKNYLTFKQWINGINALVKNKKKLQKLKTRIESYTSV